MSARIQTYLNRNLELTSHTEYFDTFPERLEYWVRAFPISSITSVHSDSTGLYDGSETAESDYYAGQDSISVVLDVGVTKALRGLRIIYTGGLATHGTQSQFTTENDGSTAITVGEYVEGQTSFAQGYVIARGSGTITIEVLAGIFEVGETIQAKATVDGALIANATTDIASATVRCLAELYPDIVQATELELRYMDDHRSDYENQSTDKGATSRKDLTKNYNLLPETRSILEPYKSITL